MGARYDLHPDANLWVADVVGGVDEICNVTATQPDGGQPPFDVIPGAMLTKSAPVAWSDECGEFVPPIVFP